MMTKPENCLRGPLHETQNNDNNAKSRDGPKFQSEILEVQMMSLEGVPVRMCPEEAVISTVGKGLVRSSPTCLHCSLLDVHSNAAHRRIQIVHVIRIATLEIRILRYGQRLQVVQFQAA